MYWVYSASLAAAGRRRDTLPPTESVQSVEAQQYRRQLANFLYLWATNATGAAELLFVNTFLGPPSSLALDPDDTYVYDENGYLVDYNLDPYAQYLNAWARMYAFLLFGYTSYVLLLSPFTINFAPLRVAEDGFLIGLAALTCYTLLLDYKFYKEG